ncbi:hypothetical protein LN042_11615 [Kitasatospora sp. RB6PN24]|uniref:hypothetical protein n=1 Tax=Kitasatospora humi TaxID=2893891 RepID=UPI001E409C3E|nr:hypothetical protein [Kitasatospora humi]MCC9307737.1 hypothetical protein [Kitasatospora humi]
MEEFDHGDARRYRRGCQCRQCVSAVTAEVKYHKYLRDTGRGLLRSPDRAAARVHALRAAGWTDLQIREVSGVGNEVLYRLLRGGRIHVRTEQRILAIHVATVGPVSGAAHISVVGTQRRLRALLVAGWPGAELARRLGVDKQQIHHHLKAPDTSGVEIATAARVRALFEELWPLQPERNGVAAHLALRARRLAQRHGWHPAAVWDDMDNPDEQPNYGPDTPRVTALVEDTSELARQGLSRDVIADRLGVTWSAIQKAHERAGAQLPELAA